MVPAQLQMAWLRPDLSAGLTTAAAAIPQAMAYAAIAVLPVKGDLYPTAACDLAGTLRPLCVSITSSIAAVT